MLRGSNLSTDVGVRLDETDLVYLPDEYAIQYPRSLVREGDLLFTCWGTVGQIGLVGRGSHDEYLISNKQMKMTPDRSRVDPLFLYYYLSQPSMISLVQASAIGSSVPGFNLGQLKTLPVRIPDLTVQIGISEVLGALDDKIEANRKLAATADDLAAAIVKRWQDSGRIERLGDVAEIVMGSSPSGKTMNEDEEGLPFYQGVRDFGLRFPTRRVWTTAPTRTARGGDILVSVRAPVGTVNYAPESLCIGRGLAAVRSRTDQQSTLFHLLRSVRSAWAEYDSGGTVFGSINRDQLHNIEIPAIRSDAEARCEAEIRGLEHRLASSLRENESLAVLRDTLLPKLMSGQLRVREAMEVAAL